MNFTRGVLASLALDAILGIVTLVTAALWHYLHSAI